MPIARGPSKIDVEKKIHWHYVTIQLVRPEPGRTPDQAPPLAVPDPEPYIIKHHEQRQLRLGVRSKA
ncbi:Protein of unknown function [Pyronema omphalodes CBS 100304]|uniref:Uncharacterized protein n=1 Tax=Pyronema omphalodes (strain CBS 100304) TaxID=1076935 RepID=U4KUV4_PYROM|nr:Protein of unknown function [Pyronema omphalodes CBS 100304]